MNKLVSKNSVLRFKQGKKIEKFYEGGQPWAGYYTVGNWPKTGNVKTPVRDGISPEELGRFNRNYPYSRSSRYKETSPRFPAIILDARFGEYGVDWGGMSGLVSDLYSNNLGYLPPKISVPYIPSNRQTQQNNTLTEVSDRSSTQQNNRLIEVSNNSSTDKTVSRKSLSNQKSSSPQLSFKNAFTRARNSGLKEFSWGGRRFNTLKKGEEGFIWSNGRWINPNIKFVVPSPTDMTPEEAEKLNRKARPIDNWQGASFAKQGIKLIPRKKLNFRLVAQ